MSELPPPTVPAPPAVQQDHFFRNLIVVLLLGVIGFIGYKAYESKQDTEHFRQEQIEKYERVLRGDD